MQRKYRRTAALAVLAAGATALGLTVTAASASSGARVTVRVEGTARTLLPATAVTLSGAPVSADGVSAHSCSGRSAAGALQAATGGRWRGSWSSSYHAYFITAIEGENLRSGGAAYWAFWVNDAPASQGICGYDPRPGDRLLFFPACYGKGCPRAAGVLAASAPARVRPGSSFTVAVTAYNETNGRPSAAAAATVSGGGASARTNGRGRAVLRIAHPGRVTLRVREAHAVRTEASVCVSSATTGSCR